MLATIRRKNPSIDLPALVALFRQVERDYLRRSLSEDVPEELEVED